MSYNSTNIPVISIIPDDDVDMDMDNDDNMNIDEVATDTEDIYFGTEKRKKKTKKHHVPKKDAYATDVEDLEGSDDDQIVPLVKHAHPISMDDMLDQTDVPAIEETYKLDEKNKRGKPKLRSQVSTTTNPHYLETMKDECNQALTDVEDFDKSSADDEESEPDIVDTDLLNEILHDAGTVAISDNVKKYLKYAPSPMVTPVNDISEDECEDDFSKPRKSFAQSSRLRPLSVSPQLSDLTDCEQLLYDSNDELKIILKPRCNRDKKNSLRRKSAFTVTDTEDMEISDGDQTKLRRISVIGLTKSKTQVIPPPSTSKGVLPVMLNELLSDEEIDSKLLGRKRPKHLKHHLNVAENLDIGLTDTEEIEGDDLAEKYEYSIPDDSTINFTGEFESYNGVVEDKVSSRKIQNLYRVKETRVVRKDRKVSDDKDTDEEEYELDMTNSENYEEIEESTIDLNFTLKKKSLMERKKQVMKRGTQSNTLTASNAMEDFVLTDVENLESSGDDDEAEEIPMTIVNKDENPTDSDSVEGDDAEENIYLDRIDEVIDDSFIPNFPRNLVKEREKDDGTCDISVTPLPDEPDKLYIPNANNDVLTDVEDFSGDDEVSGENAYDENEMPEIELDEANVNQSDSIKIPEKELEVETDVEEISIPKKQTKHTASKHFLHATNEDMNRLTDIEDFYLSDNETNGVSRMTLAPNASANLCESKTDVEDFEDSDVEQCRQVREMAVTPDILREMGGDTICSKEGDGKFSLQERQKLNERSNSISLMEEAPSPTHTDEFTTSADDENYSRAETATPIQMRQELDEASSFRVLSSNMKKINLEADEEVMYLKGGGFMTDVYTDTEEMPVSDEEYFSASDKAGDKISVCIDAHQKDQVKVSLEKQNGGMSVAWHRGSPSRDEAWKGMLLLTSSRICLLENAASNNQKNCSKTTSAKVLIYMSVCSTAIGYLTKMSVKNVPKCRKNIATCYIDRPKVVHVKNVMTSTLDFGPVNMESNNVKTYGSKSLSVVGMVRKTTFVGRTQPSTRCLSGSVSKLITRYEPIPKSQKVDDKTIISDHNMKEEMGNATRQLSKPRNIEKDEKSTENNDMTSQDTRSKMRNTLRPTTNIDVKIAAMKTNIIKKEKMDKTIRKSNSVAEKMKHFEKLSYSKIEKSKDSRTFVEILRKRSKGRILLPFGTPMVMGTNSGQGYSYTQITEEIYLYIVTIH